jgi:hypothetical protein
VRGVYPNTSTFDRVTALTVYALGVWKRDVRGYGLVTFLDPDNLSFVRHLIEVQHSSARAAARTEPFGFIPPRKQAVMRGRVPLAFLVSDLS